MNYIKRLQSENDELRRQIREAREALSDFRVHLHSALDADELRTAGERIGSRQRMSYIG